VVKSSKVRNQEQTANSDQITPSFHKRSKDTMERNYFCDTGIPTTYTSYPDKT